MRKGRLLMHRTRGLSGPTMTKHSGYKYNVKSVGNYIGLAASVPATTYNIIHGLDNIIHGVDNVDHTS